MSHNLEVRKKVIEFIEKGGSVSKAAKIYRVGRASIYRWMSREEQKQPEIKRRRKRKLDWDEVRKDIEQNPDAKLLDRAKKFGVRTNAIWYAMKEMKMTRKKKYLGTEKETERNE
jgi:putative transposase